VSLLAACFVWFTWCNLFLVQELRHTQMDIIGASMLEMLQTHIFKLLKFLQLVADMFWQHMSQPFLRFWRSYVKTILLCAFLKSESFIMFKLNHFHVNLALLIDPDGWYLIANGLVDKILHSSQLGRGGECYLLIVILKLCDQFRSAVYMSYKKYVKNHLMLSLF